MKKIYLAICFAALMMFLVPPVWSYPVDTFLGNSDKDGENFLFDIIAIPSEENEKEVFANYLGLTGEDFESSYDFIKIDGLTGNIDYTYDPGFEWYYALVKVDGPNDFSYLFQDDNGTGSLLNGDNILATGMDFIYDVSHVSFVTPKAVPEPATVMLLGFGLVGLILVSRKKIRNAA